MTDFNHFPDEPNIRPDGFEPHSAAFDKAPTRRDPTKPFSEPPLPPLNTPQFQAPKRKRLIWIILVAVLIIGMFLITFIYLNKEPIVESSPTTPTPTPVMPTAIPAKPTKLFVKNKFQNEIVFNSTANGIWRIKNPSWTSRGLEITSEITIKQGSQSFLFACFDTKTNELVPEEESINESFPTREISAGETVSGKVLFNVNPGDTTVLLVTKDRLPITALLVKKP